MAKLTAVLGDFLRPAGAHITAAAGFGGDIPVPAKRGVIAELDRLIATMARYLDDVALPADFTPASKVSHDARTALDARLALRRAASSLRPAAAAVSDAGADNAHPAVSHLLSANGYLAAGRDLLQTHFTRGPAGGPVRNSAWATVITSPPAIAALLAELAAYSSKLAAWGAQLSRTGSLYAGLPADASQGLRAASHWLRAAATSVRTAHLQQAPPAAAHRLLAAIPSNIPPLRQPLTDTEQVPELCEGITVTAERLRHAAQAFAGQARWSPAANSMSWRRDALASAITGHASELILRALAERAGQLDTGPVLRVHLAGAAEAMSQAWPMWRAIARHWDTMSTGSHHVRAITPVAAELGDLVLRTGRLAYCNPRWTPAVADTSLTRDLAELAGTASDIRIVLAAVHHAADAIACIAIHDREAVCGAADDHRLYMPTRLLPENYDIPCRYAPVPSQRTSELVGAYDTAARVTRSAARTLGDLAVSIDSTSAALAAARTSAVSPATARPPAEDGGAQEQTQPAPARVPRRQAGEIEHILRSLQITEPTMLLRAAAVDDAARDVLAHASLSSSKRDAINHPHRGGSERRQARP